jgi:hypothetical protein
MTPFEIFTRAYDILVDQAGAPGRAETRASFVSHFTTHRGALEWRFMGSLGFGGKFWRNDGRYYITCYREDETKKRKAVIDKVNRLLDALPYHEPV